MPKESQQRKALLELVHTSVMKLMYLLIPTDFMTTDQSGCTPLTCKENDQHSLQCH